MSADTKESRVETDRAVARLLCLVAYGVAALLSRRKIDRSELADDIIEESAHLGSLLSEESEVSDAT